MRILLVEDDSMIGDAIVDGLKSEGYAVDWVKDGNSATIALDTTEFSARVEKRMAFTLLFLILAFQVEMVLMYSKISADVRITPPY